MNIHSHLGDGSGTIVNVLKDFEKIPAEGSFSAGMHPWYLNEHAEEEFLRLKDACMKENVLAVGECGLDKVCDTDMALQQTWFAEQIELAKEIKKPLIIHCVRAYDEVLKMLRDHKVNVPAVFHGFNKNEVVAKGILARGYYLSFGRSILNEQGGSIFAQIPLEKVFLETDDADVRIEEVYEEAADLKRISVEELQAQIIRNAHKVFGSKFAFV